MKNSQNTSTKSVKSLSAFKNIRNLVTGFSALTLLGFFPNKAQAVIAIFEGVAPFGDETSINPYTESGFQFEGIGDTRHFVISDSQTRTPIADGSGSDFGFWQSGSQTLEITSLTNDPFSLQSFDAGNTYGQPGGLLTVTGNLNGGGTVVDTFTTAQDVFNTFNLPTTFTNLDSVRIQAQNNYVAYDNVALNEASASVPFEFSPTLGILAVGSIFGVSRLRKKAAVKLDK